MKAQGLSYHLMPQTFSPEEGETGEYVCMCVRIYMCDM